jgi:formamidopyrimidine-DNA glycosylase
MPELPEVETVARQLRAGREDAPTATQTRVPPLVGRTIVETQVLWPREIGNLSPKRFVAQTVGCCVTAVTRHGKYLIIALRPSDDTAHERYMLVHLRMSGRLEVTPQSEAHTKHARVVWLLDEGWALRFDDARKFGRVLLVDDPAQVIDAIGPDALTIGEDEFVARIMRKRGALKTLLLDQAFVAGVGNIYADEALFRAGLHPRRAAHTLADEDARRLYAAIQQVLQGGIAANGASFDWVYPGGNYQRNFQVYGQTGQPCVRCGQPIRRIIIGQRSTHFCENCQH